jgi:signal recognition particle subunit SRP54
MQELADIKSKTEPENIFLVVDAMIGQDAVKTARASTSGSRLSGVVLTKLDGDARGGAALSVKEVTGAPIVFCRRGRDRPTSSRSSAPRAWPAASSAWATSSA